MLLILRFAAFTLVALLFATVLPAGEIHESFLEPFRKIDLAPAETGVLAEIAVHEGDRIKSGQILATLDKDVLVISREIAAAAAESVGRYDAAVAEHQIRAERLKKLRELQARGHASRDEAQRAEAELAAAEGHRLSLEEQRRIDRLEIRKADAMIERRLVRTPIDGVVTRVHREQGEYVTPVSPTVVTVTQLNPLRAVFNLPQSATVGLRSGETIMLSLEEGEESVAARIEMVSPVIDADSGTIRVKLLVDNAAGKIHAGRRCFLTLNDTSVNAAAASAQDPSYVGAAK